MPADYLNYLDSKTLAKVQGIELRARMIVEGMITGMHRSPYKGFSIEFAQHRPYVAGDDIRYIDWKVFGRSDRHYIKQYEEETNLQVMLVVDASESMQYAGTQNSDWSKFDHATSIAASLAYLSLNQQDSAGLAVFDERVRRFIKPSNKKGQWRVIIDELTTTPKNQKTTLSRILHEVTEQLNHRSLVVLISDLFDDPEQLAKGVKQLRYRRHDVVVLQILDHDELTFPFQQTTQFKGLEQRGDVIVEPRSLKEAYLEELAKHSAAVREICHKLNVEYLQIDTSVPLDVSLPNFLAMRASRMK